MRDNGSGETWRATGWRWCKFSLVGAIGIVVQLGALALLTAAGMHYLVATALAVETAVLHNFAWHQNFTWSDREGAILARLARLPPYQRRHFHRREPGSYGGAGRTFRAGTRAREPAESFGLLAGEFSGGGPSGVFEAPASRDRWGAMFSRP